MLVLEYAYFHPECSKSRLAAGILLTVSLGRLHSLARLKESRFAQWEGKIKSVKEKRIEGRRIGDKEGAGTTSATI